MRLTLRTLLSYMDNVLEEPARSELHRQIEGSEHASEWVHRTRDVMRRLRLGAPPAEGSGSADDPNTVAEYLDRTLPEESVSEFERVCLESDLMLAEVASCHHVLAMFLSETPEVDPDTRRRLHRLRDDLAEAMAVRATSPPSPPVDAPEERSDDRPADSLPAREPQPAAAAERAPFYLRQREVSPLKRWAPALAALVLLAITLAVALGPGGLLDDKTQVAEIDPLKEPATPDDADTTADDSDAAPEEPSGAQDDASDEQPIDEPEAADAEPADRIVADDTPDDEPAPSGEPADDAPPAPAGEGDPAGPMPAPGSDDPDATDSAPEEPSETEPPPAIRYASGPGVLAVAQTPEGLWRRIAPNEESTEALRIVSPPAYRSKFRLSDTLSVELVGQTEAVLTPATASGEGQPGGDGSESEGPSEEPANAAPPKVQVAYGKLLLRTPPTAESDATVDLVVDGLTHRVTLGPDAALAIEADRFYRPGELSDEAAQPLVAIANGLSGTIAWTSKGVDMKFSKPKQWYVSGESSMHAPAGFGDPSWTEAMALSPPDQFAAPAVSEAIDPARPVWPQLMELAAEPYREVRSLAGRASLALGHPEPMVDSFRQPEESAAWRSNLVALRQSASRSPERMAQIERAFAEKYGPAAAGDLVELVVGFGPEEIGADAAALSQGAVPNVIVPLLESEDLASRVLASLVLEESVQPLERPYDPLDTLRKRARAVQVLTRLIREGELRPATR